MRRLILTGIALVAFFILYLASAYPAVSPYRDSGDLAAAAFSLGIAHAPGYPLYVLAGHAWLDLLPWGDIAYRLHVLSALLAVVALSLVLKAFKGMRKAGSTEDDGPAVDAGAGMAVLLLGLSPAFWHLAITSEMYSLNALCAAGLLVLASSENVRASANLYASALLLGVGLTNHQTLALAVPGLLWMRRPLLSTVRARAGAGPALRALLALAGLSGLGLALYLYLPVRSLAEPVLDWGAPRTPEMFWRMLTRADLGAIRLHPERPAGFLSLSQWLAGASLCARMLIGQTGWSGALLAAWGLWACRRRRLAQGAFLAFLVSGPGFIGWANLDASAAESLSILEPHALLPVLFACVLAGLGASDLWRRSAEAIPGTWHARKGLALATLLAAFLAGWIVPLRESWASLASCRNDYSAWDYGRALLDSLEPGAVLIDPDDTTAFALSYLQTVKGQRPDIRPVLFFRTRWGYQQLRQRHPELLPPWELRSGQELHGALLSHNMSRDVPVYVDLPQKVPQGMRALPSGLAYRLLQRPLPVSERGQGLDAAIRIQRLLRLRPVPMAGDFFTQHTGAYGASQLSNLGIEAQRLGRPGDAAMLYRRALLQRPSMPEAWNNLGNASLSLNDLAGAEGAYRIARSIKPSPHVTYNLGRVYLLQSRYGDAERAFESALSEAALPEARNDLGLVYYRTGRIREAVRLWEELLESVPGYVTPLYNLGMAYRDLKDFKRARIALTLFRDHSAMPEDRADADRELRRLPDR